MKEKRVFKINVDPIPDGDIEAYVKSITEKFKKTELPGSDLDINMDIEYMTEKRDQALERFNKKIKDLKSDEVIQESFTSLMRINTQLRMMEDARTIYNNTINK